MIEVTSNLVIPANEVRFETSTSSGPGGQHVNRAQTRITLLFDVEASTTLSGSQRRRIRDRLATRIDRAGMLRVRCGRHRSQAQNRDETVRRFAALLRDALAPTKYRVATRPTKSARRRRVDDKKRRSGVKQTRRPPSRDD